MTQSSSSFITKNKDDMLILACAEGDLEAAKGLLEDGATPNHADTHGITPLFMAVSRGDEAIVNLLIEASASPTNQVKLDEIAGKNGYPVISSKIKDYVIAYKERQENCSAKINKLAELKISSLERNKIIQNFKERLKNEKAYFPLLEIQVSELPEVDKAAMGILDIAECKENISASQFWVIKEIRDKVNLFYRNVFNSNNRMILEEHIKEFRNNIAITLDRSEKDFSENAVFSIFRKNKLAIMLKEKLNQSSSNEMKKYKKG